MIPKGTHKGSKLARADSISNMPGNIVTNILNRLPLQEAVRTSILSRSWRFKWTMLSQLVFDEEFFDYLLSIKHWNDYERIISRLLLNLKVPITKFVLYMQDLCNAEDFAHWIMFLSREGVENLTITNMDTERLKLPTHLFSCLGLKHLKLENCCYDPPMNFHGFPNLLSLELRNVEFESEKFGEFFTPCPVLETLNLGYTEFEGQVKLVEIAKLTNLKILTLFFGNVDDTTITSSSFIFDLVASLAKLEKLHLDFDYCKSFTEDGARKTPHITSPCLKTLKLSNIDFDDGIMLSLAFGIIRSSPNLQTLEIEAHQQGANPQPAISFLEVDYNTMELLQLQSVVFRDLKGSKNEVRLIKHLLSCSPFLRKIAIRLDSILNYKRKFWFARKLLKLYRVSPIAEIDL